LNQQKKESKCYTCPPGYLSKKQTVVRTVVAQVLVNGAPVDLNPQPLLRNYAVQILSAASGVAYENASFISLSNWTEVGRIHEIAVLELFGMRARPTILTSGRCQGGVELPSVGKRGCKSRQACQLGVFFEDSVANKRGNEWWAVGIDHDFA